MGAVVNNYWLPLWGGQNKPTPLDRVSVRRLSMYIQKKVIEILRDNRSVSHDISNLLDDLLSRKAFEEYDWIMDTRMVIIGIQPKWDSPWIYLEFKIGI